MFDKITEWLYDHFGLPGFIVGMLLLVGLFFGLLTLWTRSEARSIPASQVEALLSDTYTNVELGELEYTNIFSWKGCSRDDAGAYHFTGYNIHKNLVEGTVCISHLYNELSIRPSH